MEATLQELLRRAQVCQPVTTDRLQLFGHQFVIDAPDLVALLSGQERLEPVPSQDSIFRALEDLATLSIDQLDKTAAGAGFDVAGITRGAGMIHHFCGAFALEARAAQQHDLLQCMHKLCV